mgnify:CR=1 FL=1
MNSTDLLGELTECEHEFVPAVVRATEAFFNKTTLLRSDDDDDDVSLSSDSDSDIDSVSSNGEDDEDDIRNLPWILLPMLLGMLKYATDKDGYHAAVRTCVAIRRQCGCHTMTIQKAREQGRRTLDMLYNMVLRTFDFFDRVRGRGEEDGVDDEIESLAQMMFDEGYDGKTPLWKGSTDYLDGVQGYMYGKGLGRKSGYRAKFLRCAQLKHFFQPIAPEFYRPSNAPGKDRETVKKEFRQEGKRVHDRDVAQVEETTSHLDARSRPQTHFYLSPPLHHYQPRPPSPQPLSSSSLPDWLDQPLTSLRMTDLPNRNAVDENFATITLNAFLENAKKSRKSDDYVERVMLRSGYSTNAIAQALQEKNSSNQEV